MIEVIGDRYVYLLVVALLAIGLWTLLTERNLLKKVVGLTIFQTAIFLFFIEGSVRDGADVPVIDPEVGPDPTAYVNPLPHLLILTALVVGVAVTGVALALARVVHRAYGTLDEAVIADIDGAAAGDETQGDGPGSDGPGPAGAGDDASADGTASDAPGDGPP